MYLGVYEKNDITLCISNKEKNVKRYMEDTRGLSKKEYYIVFNENRLYSEELEVFKYSKGLYLTNIDITYLNEEINMTMNNFLTLQEKYKSFMDIIYYIIPREDHKHFNEVYKLMGILVKDEARLKNAIILNSDVLSKDINKYIEWSLVYKDYIEYKSRFSYLSNKED